MNEIIELTGDRTKALDSILTRDEFLEMMKAGNDAKDRAILALGVLGLRASEMAACEANWIDFSNRTIVIPPRAAKRGKGRVVPFGKIKVICDVVTAFFALERRIGISRIAIWNRVKRMASAAAIKHPVTPHGLRATGATWFAQGRLLDNWAPAPLRLVGTAHRAALRAGQRCQRDEGHGRARRARVLTAVGWVPHPTGVCPKIPFVLPGEVAVSLAPAA
jgi:integrase